MEVTGSLRREVTSQKDLQDHGGGAWGSPGRHGHASALRSCKVSKARGLGNTDDI